MALHEDGWKNVEQGLLLFIRSIITGSDADNSFKGEPPGTYDKANENFFWWIDVSGGDEPIDDFNVDQAGGCGLWRMDALFRGVYESRETAQTHAGLMHKNTPVAELTVITGVQRFRAKAEATLARAIVTLEPDQTKGGDERMWDLQYQFLVVFDPTVVDGTLVP